MSEAEDRQRPLGAGQPVYVLSEDAERTQGRDAQTANITAGKAVAEAVRTTLGPNGMDKMLVSDDGDVVITNDGATILSEMDIEHPAATMIVEVADAQDEEVGDGTTSAAVLTGELLSEAEDLLDDEVHPTTIVEGYAAAREIAVETIDDGVVSADLDEATLEQIAATSMTGKSTGDATAEHLAGTIVDAVSRVRTDDGVDRDAIDVLAVHGRSSTATELLEGSVFEKDPERDDVPRQYDDATVALLSGGIEQPETEVDVEYNVRSADQFADAVAAEETYLGEAVETLIDLDVDVVFADDTVEDEVAGRLAHAGILTYDVMKDEEIDRLARTTGADPAERVEDLSADDLGTADVRRETYDDDEHVFVEGGDASSVVTVFVRGGTGHVVDEFERAVTDGIDAVVAALDGGGAVPGAGATEIRIAGAIREAAAGIEGRKQLAVEAFADAVEALPRTLAQNAGRDPIDALVELRAANDDGRAGIVGAGGESAIVDPVERGVLDPAAVKREAVRSATEAATMIVRIDDVISAQ
ncbi:MAG: thermosome subunit alpha [Haloferacaceae archaeon]